MANERAWYVYTGTPGTGVYNSSNYLYSSFFPNCVTTGDFICSIKGIYRFEDEEANPYGPHPAPFSLDSKLNTYITNALSADAAYPPIPSQKPYVYVKATA
jgi:hypothetical protein